jgi:hypothetical protein
MTTEAYRPGPCGGSAANNHVEIDLPTGLPKLSIELLPEEEKPQRKHPPLLDYIHRLPVGLHVSPAEMAARLPRNNSTTLTRDLESPASMDLRHSASSPECRQRSYSGTGSGFNRHAKHRSSLFIKLHRTSTFPQRLSILAESGSSDTGIHTAPVVGNDPDGQFSFPEGTGPPSADPLSSHSSSTPDLLSRASPEDITPPLPSPSTGTKRLAAAGRRNSFLYESDGDTAHPVPSSMSRS